MWPEFGDQDMWLMSIPWNHLLDIGVMWFLAYQVYIRFRRTQAMRLLVRVFIVWLAYLAAQAGTPRREALFRARHRLGVRIESGRWALRACGAVAIGRHSTAVVQCG